MTTFTLDTSGVVVSPPGSTFGAHIALEWTDLTPFQRGYIEAMLSPPLILCTFNEPTGELPWKPMDTRNLGFSDLSPEALALILKDCEEGQDGARGGQLFWEMRQRGAFKGNPLFPPLTVTLDDAGKVQLRAVAGTPDPSSVPGGI